MAPEPDKPIDWVDIAHHAIGGVVAGLLAGILALYGYWHWSIIVLVMNGLGWFIRELAQSVNGALTKKQGLLEWIPPAIVAPLVWFLFGALT